MDRPGHEDTNFFTGVEVEDIPTYGMKTLFVVGIQSVSAIAAMAEAEDTDVIYFGANHSFMPKGKDLYEAWKVWEDMIKPFLDDGYWCVLDLDSRFAEDLCESCLPEFVQFIPVISVKLPYINQLGYNAHLKIDDKDFGATNPGVWVHRLHSLMDEERFTQWPDYLDDETVG